MACALWAASILYVELCIRGQHILPFQSFFFAGSWMLSLAAIFFFLSVPSMLRIRSKLYSALSQASVSMVEFQSAAPAVRRDFINRLLPSDDLADYVAHEWLRRPHDRPRVMPKISLNFEPFRSASRWLLLKEVLRGYAWLRTLLLAVGGSAGYVLIVIVMGNKSWSVDAVARAMSSATIVVLGVAIWIFATTILDHLGRLAASCDAIGMTPQEFSGKTPAERRVALRATFPGATFAAK
jgi:hypothetical protein